MIYYSQQNGCGPSHVFFECLNAKNFELFLTPNFEQRLPERIERFRHSLVWATRVGNRTRKVFPNSRITTLLQLRQLFLWGDFSGVDKTCSSDSRPEIMFTTVSILVKRSRKRHESEYSLPREETASLRNRPSLDEAYHPVNALVASRADRRLLIVAFPLSTVTLSPCSYGVR